tara:strand:- start:81 stop:290 length:210 start_codon:yes stop_codon:yes gene_type:complete
MKKSQIKELIREQINNFGGGVYGDECEGVFINVMAQGVDYDTVEEVWNEMEVDEEIVDSYGCYCLNDED